MIDDKKDKPQDDGGKNDPVIINPPPIDPPDQIIREGEFPKRGLV